MLLVKIHGKNMSYRYADVVKYLLFFSQHKKKIELA